MVCLLFCTGSYPVIHVYGYVCMYEGRIFLISHLSYHVYVSVCVSVCGACCGARLSRDRRGDGWCRMAVLRLTGPGNIIRKRRPPSSRTGGPRSGRPHRDIPTIPCPLFSQIFNYMMYVCIAWMAAGTYLLKSILNIEFWVGYIFIFLIILYRATSLSRLLKMVRWRRCSVC